MNGWFGPWELLIVLAVVLLIFGPKRLPSLGRSLGQGARSFKEAITGRHKEAEDEIDEPGAASGRARAQRPRRDRARDREGLLAMPGWIGPWEILILLVVILLVFGPKRLPEFGKSLGKGMREFKNSVREVTEDHEPEELPPPPPKP